MQKINILCTCGESFSISPANLRDRDKIICPNCTLEIQGKLMESLSILAKALCDIESIKGQETLDENNNPVEQKKLVEIKII